MKIFDAAAVHAALDWSQLADAIERAFRGTAHVPLRHAHELSKADALLLMPAWDSQIILLKLVTVIPSAPDTVQATVLVVDRATGKPLAVLDGEAVTQRRTAATSALAAQHLALPDAETLLVVGTGRLSLWMARAHAALRVAGGERHVRPLRRILVWGRNLESAQKLAHTLEFEGLPVQAVDDLEKASRQAQIICCATTSKAPLIQGDWLAAGTHLDLVGSFKPDMREVDDTAVVRSRVIVDTYQGALAEAGDLVQPIKNGLIQSNHVVGDLAGLLKNEYEGRKNSGDITLFKSVGTALEDLAAAHLIMKRDQP